eukprot:3291074-Pleurochrysis_carterae.AAC.1
MGDINLDSWACNSKTKQYLVDAAEVAGQAAAVPTAASGTSPRRVKTAGQGSQPEQSKTPARARYS